MKHAARFATVVVVTMIFALVAPRPIGRVFTPDAAAQVLPLPTPTIPPIDPDPTPTPEPTPTLPGDPGGGGGGGGDGDSGGGDNGGGKGDNGGPKGGKGDNTGGVPEIVPLPDYTRIEGAYNTDILLAVRARLRSLGWSEEEVTRKVFAPFIIGGKANWIDSWGFPRFGPGPIIRTHEGQDVFCEYGDPILAAEKGVIDFAEGGLGGKVARLHRQDGSYFYYAHLSEWNTAEFATGDRVEPGDVIGSCGNSGNAQGGAAHVHFGLYGTDGDAINPIKYLNRWLRTAEKNAIRLAQTAAHKKVRKQDVFAAAHRFGDAFVPSLAEFDISGDPLLASGTTPASGAFALAEAAVQAALSQAAIATEASATVDADGAGTSSGSGLEGVGVSPDEAGD